MRTDITMTLFLPVMNMDNRTGEPNGKISGVGYALRAKDYTWKRSELEIQVFDLDGCDQETVEYALRDHYTDAEIESIKFI